MKTANEWFAEYGESHQNPTNKLIHWICVPVIFYCVLGLLYQVPMLPIEQLPVGWRKWDVLVSGAGLLFYLRLSKPLFIGFLLYVTINLFLVRLLDAAVAQSIWWFVGLFVLAWIGQFIGHKIEGQKPSFLKDLQFLLIGPAWLMSFVYQRLGLKY
jgi:uncharacterized membrane protein YGL010W